MEQMSDKKLSDWIRDSIDRNEKTHPEVSNYLHNHILWEVLNLESKLAKLITSWKINHEHYEPLDLVGMGLYYGYNECAKELEKVLKGE